MHLLSSFLFTELTHAHSAAVVCQGFGLTVKDKKTGVAIRRMMAIPLDVQRVSFRVINVFDGHITAPLSVVLNVALYIFA